MSKRKPESETATYASTDTSPEGEKAARKSRTYPRGPIIIQQATPAGPDEPAGWADLPSSGLTGKREARAHAEVHAYAGKFRVIEVLDEFETEVVNTPVVKFR